MSNSLRSWSAHWPTESVWDHIQRASKQILRAPAQSLLAHSPDSISAAVYAIRKYRYTFGRYPNIITPGTFNEKVQARKILDRRAIFSTWVDKVAVRDYVTARSASCKLPKLHCVTTNPDSIPFDRLPQRYVVKASHGSGWVRIVKDNASVDRASLVTQCWKWLEMNYFRQNGELAYKDVIPNPVGYDR
jgi:teichuronopeptide biosynthesis TupA-like protein